MKNQFITDGAVQYAMQEWKSNEFNEEDYDVPAFLTEANGWKDNSWHNDVCPRWHNDKKRICLWIGQTDKKDECASIYLIQRINADGEVEYDGGKEDLIFTDSLNELTAFLDGCEEVIPTLEERARAYQFEWGKAERTEESFHAYIAGAEDMKARIIEVLGNYEGDGAVIGQELMDLVQGV